MLRDIMKISHSIVVPVYNEEESLQAFFDAVDSSLKKQGVSYEMLFIDDGSNDSSLEILKKIEKKNSHVRIFSFRRNLGKSSALTLGFRKAVGDYIVTLDADLQDDPDDISGMIEKLQDENLDLVSGWRKNRSDSFLKVVSSRIFNLLMSFLFSVRVHDLNCGLKVYRSDAAGSLNLYGGMHRFIPIIVREMGFRIGEYVVKHHSRKYGISKYSSTKIFSDIPDLFTIYFIMKYNNRPLHFFGKFGGLVFLIGFIILLYLSVLWLYGVTIGDRPLLLFGVLLFITGIQVISTGLIADLVVNLSGDHRETFQLKYETK